jgi:hypothetical protein
MRPNMTRDEIQELERINRQARVREIQDREALNRARSLVAEQAMDDSGLWFEAETITEAYLQTALRDLHQAIEGETDERVAARAKEVLRGRSTR